MTSFAASTIAGLLLLWMIFLRDSSVKVVRLYFWVTCFLGGLFFRFIYMGGFRLVNPWPDHSFPEFRETVIGYE